MPGYTTRLLTIRLGGHDFRIRALSDLQQFADPTGSAHRAGISSSLWSLFGQVWPSGRVLAEAMSRFDIAGKRILELAAAWACPAWCWRTAAQMWWPVTTTPWPNPSWPTTPA